MKKIKKIILCFTFFISPVFGENSPPLVIGSKTFTENILLGELLAVLLEEKYQQKVERKLNIGGTKLVFDALNSKQIDVYPDYTGTGYTMILKLSGETRAEKIYQIVKQNFLKKFQIHWSPPLGFNNTYTLALQKDDARFKSVNQISELKGKEQNLSLAVGHEFMEREDGYDSFTRMYQLNFPKNKIHTMNPALMYSALKNKKADLIMAYSTNGKIKSYNLKTLEDDKNFFPPYHAAYLTRLGVLKQFPSLKKAFQELKGNINEKEMTNLNYQMEQRKDKPALLAKNFLIKKNILNKKIVQFKKQNLIGYYFSKRDYFFKIFIEHLVLTFSALFLSLFLSIPIGILSARKKSLEKIVFPIVNTFQTIPGLALLGLLIPFLGIGYAPAILTLFIYSLLPLIRNTYEGIKGVDRDCIEVSIGMGLTPWQVLKKVEIPMALPVIIAGVRTSTVIVVGTATLAALVGAGGLGDPIFRGIATVNSKLIFLGAVPAALLAIVLDKALSLTEKILVSKGLRLRQNSSF